MSIFRRLGSLPLSLGDLPPIQIGESTIGHGRPAFIIAEIGTSHGGDLDAASRLIEAASEAGADCAKFQAVFADEIVHPLTGDVKLPGGATPLFEVFKNLERDAGFYARLKRITEAAGLFFLCTPFGLRSAAILRDIGVDAVKIASPEINHIPMLQEIASWRIPVVLSTGVSTMGDVELALSILPEETVVLHCVTSYPAPEEEYNVLCVPVLSATFGKLTGISDHSLDPSFIPALAVAYGGCVIEKHFTLDRDGGGLDDPVALTPRQFRQMTETVRAVETMDADERSAYLCDRYSRQRVMAASGNGVKKLAATERSNYQTTNRSIMAVKQIPEGSVIAPDAVALLRSEKNLNPGLPPQMLADVIGRIAARTIPNGTGLSWDDLLAVPEKQS